MPVEQLVEGVGDHEVDALLLERLDRLGRTLAEPLASSFTVLAGQVGVLLAARERELLLDDLLVEHEPASGRGRS